ncbi:unnamed protein product [Larinioides sclopetarius]|uniref:Caspase family p20 domain-containing protein n=1 Tax=Larinioides sclopetarius TaxID=280406 RepID=A0AAV2B708_9ARAC
MDYRHREVIKKYSPILRQSINLDQDDMVDCLSKSKIFTTRMLKDIYHGKASFFEELPTRGPDAFFQFIKLLKRNSHTPIADKLCHVAIPAYQISNKNGYSHITLNYEFEKINSEGLERGFILEASNLDSALQKKFNCNYNVNRKADELYSDLKEFSEMDSLGSANSCIVIILSFGTKDKNSKVIYGSDGEYVRLHDILNLFSDANCPSLKHKPKIFLLPSFDDSHSDSIERVELSTDVNDTFLWYFPPVKFYKCVNNVQDGKFFGQILSEKIRTDDLAYDFESVLKSSYKVFINQLNRENIPIDDPEFEQLGFCREKILFT